MGATLTTQELDCELQQHSSNLGVVGQPLPPESYTHMGNGDRVQLDTLVSIGNRCHNTFHLLTVFFRLEGGGREAKVERPFSRSCKIKKCTHVVQRGGFL